MFLQEVDFRMNRRYLDKYLTSIGFACCFKVKAKVVNEGLMVAFRRDRFSLVNTNDVWLTDLLNVDNYPENRDISEYLQKDKEAYAMFTSRPNILQMVHLRGEYGNLFAANTHLFFDPRYETVKVFQTLLCLRYIARMRQQFPDALCLFAGDFNSTPDSAAVQLIRTGVLDKEHVCWGGNGIALQVEGKAAEQKTYESLCGYPKYTNYTHVPEIGGFAGCLDYIWACPGINVSRVMPLPSHELVTKYGAIPSKITPSDHLPIMCDIELHSS
jgi:2',5'-phosphodiesterase